MLPVQFVFLVTCVAAKGGFAASLEVLLVFEPFADPVPVVSCCVGTSVLLLDAVGLWQAIVTSPLLDVERALTASCSCLLAMWFGRVMVIFEPPLLIGLVFWSCCSLCMLLLCPVCCDFAVSVTLLAAF